MNKLFSLFALIAITFSLSSHSAFAQKEYKQGVITLELTEVTADDPQMAAQLDMIKGSTTVLSFSDEKSLLVMDMMGGMVQTSILTDLVKNEGFMLMNMDMVGIKTRVNLSSEELDKRKAESAKAGIEVTYDKSDTKKIAGFDCYKATIVMPNSGGAEMVAYVTKGISTKASVIPGIDATILDGFPLEYSIAGPGMKMIYTTVDIKDEVDSSVFNINTDGYEVQSMEEFQKTMGAMGGGMGF